MILVPMQNTWQFDIVYQLLETDFYADGVEADAFGGIADAKHRHAFSCDETFFTQGLESVVAAVVFGDHAQAGGAAVHGV